MSNSTISSSIAASGSVPAQSAGVPAATNTVSAGAITLSGLSVSYGDRTIIPHLDASIPGGAVTTIIGPNGCGKSTMLRAAAQLITSSGSIFLDDVDVRSLRRKELARRMVVLAVCVVLCVWISFELRASELGPDVASSLGQSRRLVESAILAMSVVLAACAVSAGGPIGFVAFVAPQVAMRLAGTTSPPLFTSLLTGSVLLLVADIATQTVLPTELPVGLITSAVGGVFLIYLLVRTSRKATI